MKTQYIFKHNAGTFYYSDKKMKKLHREDGAAVEFADGTKAWYFNGFKHRKDGPAIEWFNGIKYWYLNGQLHREDGPACEYTSGTKEWYLNGLLHREDGPAIEYASGSKLWYLNGFMVTEAEFRQRTTKLELTIDEIAAKFNVSPKNLKIKK